MIMRLIHPERSFRTTYRVLIGLLAFALVFEPVALLAQTRRKTDTSDQQNKTEKRGFSTPFSQQSMENRAEQEGAGTQQKIPIASISQAAYKAVIASGRYILGPGDGFAVVVDTGDEIEANEVLIGAGGDLVIPHVGTVSLAGKSLAEANDLIQKTINSRFHHLNITVTLSRLRAFPIGVVGQVQYPGAYGVLGVQQVSDLITAAGGLIDDPEHRASMRNIEILHLENGKYQPTGRRADLMLWNLTGEEKYNPFLLDGEEVFVPARNDSVSISGAVRQPDNYEFAPGDRVSDLLVLGGGLRDRVIPKRAELLRLSSGNTRSPIPIDLARAIARDPEADLPLQAGDKLYIWGEEHWVYVEGEVRFPGPYPIEQGLTLKTLLERAQVKPEASLEQASLIRRVDYGKKATTDEDVVLKRLLDIPRDQRTNAEEALITLKTQQLSGRLPVDFSALMAGNKQSDILLRDGDVIRLPRFVSSVRVYGAVLAPANIPYDSTAVLEDYITRAGGFSDRAKRNEVVLVQGSTGNAISDASLQRRIDPGDAVYVPERTATSGQGYRFFREALSVSASIASLLLTIQALNR